MTKEEYKKTLIRMWDSIRDEYKGVENCDGVRCNKCPLEKVCVFNSRSIINSFEMIDEVEKWGKEHPLVTNRDKFKEVFGNIRFSGDKDITEKGCGGLICPRDRDFLPCNKDCPNYGFWDREYKEGEKR